MASRRSRQEAPEQSTSANSPIKSPLLLSPWPASAATDRSSEFARFNARDPDRMLPNQPPSYDSVVNSPLSSHTPMTAQGSVDSAHASFIHGYQAHNPAYDGCPTCVAMMQHCGCRFAVLESRMLKKYWTQFRLPNKWTQIILLITQLGHELSTSSTYFWGVQRKRDSEGY